MLEPLWTDPWTHVLSKHFFFFFHKTIRPKERKAKGRMGDERGSKEIESSVSFSLFCFCLRKD